MGTHLFEKYLTEIAERFFSLLQVIAQETVEIGATIDDELIRQPTAVYVAVMSAWNDRFLTEHHARRFDFWFRMQDGMRLVDLRKKEKGCT